MNCWIVCEPCEDAYYAGYPTGKVFLNKANAEEYLKNENRSVLSPYALYIVEGELMDNGGCSVGAVR